jgi:L-fuculose-phosphate aldolase
MAMSTSATVTDPVRLHEDLATVFRSAVALGLIDHAGFAASRLPDGRIVTTPGPRSAARFGRLSPEDLVILPADSTTEAAALDSAVGILPREIALATATLGEEPGSTLILGAPDALLLLSSVGRLPLALAHTNAELVHAGITLVRPDGLALDPDRARDLLGPAGAAPTVVLAGHGVLVRGPSPFEALRRLDGLELLARMTVACGEERAMRTVSPSEAESVARSRPVEREPSRDPVRYFRTIDPGVHGRTLADELSAHATPHDTDEARTLLAIASRVLAARGLVTYYEHLSSRIPGASDRFLMTPAHDYHQMLPSDVGIVGMEGDCEPIECRFPPAPFRWLHRDLFLARPDAQAIVHTHPMHGRIRHLVGSVPTLSHREAVLAPTMTPVLGRPSLLFSDEDRAELGTLLADGPVVHALHHGTDFLAPTVAEATMMAVHDEELARYESEARRVGKPAPLSEGLVHDLRREGTTATARLAFLASRLPGFS